MFLVEKIEALTLLQTVKDQGALPNFGILTTCQKVVTCCAGHLVSFGKLGHTSKDRVVQCFRRPLVKMGAGQRVLHELYLTTAQAQP